MSNALSHASILEACGTFQDPTKQGSLFVNMTTKVIKVKPMFLETLSETKK
jgi:hypothetical protein